MLAPAFFLAGLPGGWELWIILFIILVLFGTRLPKVARSLGQGISEFKKGVADPLTEDPEPDPPKSEPKKITAEVDAKSED